MRALLLVVCILSAICVITAQTTESEVPDMIIEEGMENSQVMDIASWMCDVHGPRLTGSPGLDEATKWARKQLKAWGLKNVHFEEWGPFGRGWQLQHFEMHAHSPQYWTVLAYPKAWSPSVSGSGDVVFFDVKNEEDLEKYRGKLAGKFVLMDEIREVEEWMKPPARRFDSEDLLNMANAVKPVPRARRNWNYNARSFNTIMWEFLEREKPIAVLDRSYKGDLGTIFVSQARGSGSVRSDTVDVVPQATLAVEHYNRIMRLLEKDIVPRLSLDMRCEYVNDDGMEANIIAEIPGTDLADEVVMFGAHFDSWHTGTGATDNAAGSSVMMEVARILQTVIEQSGERPRRTLRLALWTGEEQGLHGSRAYVDRHYAELGERGWTPQSLRPDQEKISAYYNLDNGTGKIRGIYLQGNDKVANIFRDWLEPFRSEDAATVTLANTGGTDHLPFHGAGIPAFQFIQDPIAYSARTHHSNMDNWDHLVADDLKQAATIIATFVWNTAQRDDRLPRIDIDLERATTSSND